MTAAIVAALLALAFLWCVWIARRPLRDVDVWLAEADRRDAARAERDRVAS